MSTIHERTVELIPWYVNGTLQAEESRAVEQHLSECLPCRAALKQEQRLGGLVREQADVAPGTGHGISDLLKTIDADRTRTGGARRPARILWGAGLAAAVLVAVLAIPALLNYGDRFDTGDFATLGDARSTSQPRLDIVFADGLTETERSEIVAAVGGRLIAGPTELGRYTVEIVTPDPQGIDPVIERLRENPQIRFVGRNFIDPSRSTPEEP